MADNRKPRQRRGLIPLGLDFETYYDLKDYTLSKLTTSQYILDPRFEAIGVGLGLGATLPAWYTGDHTYLKTLLGKIPWDRTLLIAHNAIFDGAILEWVFGYQPAAYFCTMMASRPYVAPFTGRMSLASVMKYFDIGTKGNSVENYSGYRRANFSAAQLAEYGDYCCNDVVGACRAYEILSKNLPDDEQEILDLTIKKFTRPVLKLDQTALQTRSEAVLDERAKLVGKLALVGVGEDEVRSRPKFARALALHGVNVAMKKSKTAKNEDGTAADTLALSKTDVSFMELLGHDNEIVRDLVQARLKLMSNMEITRLARLNDIAELNIGGDMLLPVPLLYYGAHPGRFSGLDKINLQNLSRIKYLADNSQDPESGWLRRSIVAPDGYVIIAADLSNIEARLVATLAGQHDMIEGFRQKKDLYSEFATRVYGRPINKKDNPDERFVGKTCILGLGYGMGWLKFLSQMVLAKAKGIDEPTAKRIVYLYRDTYENIPRLWGVLEQYLRKAIAPDCMVTFGPLTFLHERIVLPNGMPIIYPGLRLEKDSLVFTNKRSSEEGFDGNLWGGGVTENVCQGLARIIITTAELRLARLGLKAALQVHDELVYCVPEKHAAACKKAIEMSLRAGVEWLPMLPVDCEVGIGKTYAECK